MPEPFPDPMAKWTPTPAAARLDRPGLSVARVEGLSQTLVSGDLGRALAELGAASVGLWEIAPDGPFAARIGRDRALLVGATTPAPGWRDGWAASPIDDGYAVLALTGAALTDVVAEACAAELSSPSAATLFAGVPALLYRTSEAEARLHVEAPFLAYVWRWLETR